MRIGILGTGLMGAAIARRLLARGHEVAVWNRTTAKAERLAGEGAAIASTPSVAIEKAEVVLVTLADAGAIEGVLMDEDSLRSLPGRTVVQMGTIAPGESRQFAERIRAAGGEYLEAPVLGSTPQALDGKLILMLAGDEKVFEAQRPLLGELAGEPRFVGEVGKAASLKLALNQLLVSHVASFSLSLGMVLRADIPLDDFMAIVRNSALHTPQFDKKLPRMLDRDFSDPHFPVSHMLKDVRLILDEARRLELGIEALEGIHVIVARALEMGYVEVDYSALYNAVNPREG